MKKSGEIASSNVASSSVAPQTIRGNPLTVTEDCMNYGMTRKPRGLCLTLCHENFNDNELTPLKGALADQQSLINCFGRLDFDVIPHKDLTYSQLKKVIDHFSLQTDHSNYDCFVCCVTTHGDSNTLYASDKFYPISRLMSNFRGDVCGTLAGKPKIFIIDACMGLQWEEGVEVVCQENENFDGLNCTIPTTADFLIAYSTVDGYVSWQDPSSGSWYIQNLTETINEYSQAETPLDLISMLTVVNRRVAFNCGFPLYKSKVIKQMPSIYSTLTRRVYFPRIQ